MLHLSQTWLRLDVALKLELGGRRADGMVVQGWFLWKKNPEKKKYNSEFNEFYGCLYIERPKCKTATEREPSNMIFL